MSSASFSPDGKMVVTGSNDKTVKIWDTQSGKELKTFAEHNAVPKSVSFSIDGTKVLATSEDFVTVWDTTSGKVLKYFDKPGEVILPGYTKNS